jgi:hypothetical protein
MSQELVSLHVAQLISSDRALFSYKILVLERCLFYKQCYCFNGLCQQGKLAEAEHELERLWGSSQVKQAMTDLVLNEQTQDNGTTSWRALLDPRYIKGTH